MAIRSNLAYEKKLTQPQIVEEKKQQHIGRIKKQQIKKIKATAYISLIVIACVVLCFYIMEIVKTTELTSKINLTKNQYKIQQSENIRLKSILESKFFNTAEIEKYATEKLGMRKNISHVNYYLHKPNKRKIESKSAVCENFSKKENLIDRLKNWIENLF